MASGILAMLAPKPKMGSAPADDEEDAPPSSGGSEDKLFRLAVQAIADGDEGAAVDALRGAVEACIKKQEAGEYPPEG